jgi:hypothetical protein
LIITGTRLQDGAEVFTSLVEKSNKMRSEINERKTKYMTAPRRLYNENGYVELVHIILNTYLGTVLTNKN